MLSSWTACHCWSTTAALNRSTRSGLAGCWMVQVSRTAEQHHGMRRETVTETTCDTADSPPKRRRVDWIWECPACSNKHPSGPRLLLHMHKCCGDLLPSTYDRPYLQELLAQEQSQQHSQQTHRQQPDGQQPSLEIDQLRADSADSTQHFQQVLAAAGEQEHTLRMQALRLRFIGEATQAHAQAAPEAEDVDDGLVDSSPTTSPGSHPTAVQEPGVKGHPTEDAESTTATGAAAAAATGAPAAACDDSNVQKPGVAKRRGKLRSSARVPVRSIEQVMQAMQLPHARVLKLLERAPRSIRLVSDKEPVQVVYEDNAFLAICKPPGLRSAPVHRFMGGSAVNRIIGYLGAEPHLLHRLDMDTSGVLVAAKDAATANAVNSQFQAKQVSKAYLALCLGVPEQQQFIVDGPIGQHPDVTVARKVVPDGQHAVTHVQVLSVSTACPHAAAATLNGSSSSVPVWGPAAAADAVSGVRGAGCCLVCCRPVTGRTHQIRVHMAHSGHPLLGDDVYGLQGPWIGRQALHAVSLTLTHPGTGQPVTFQAAPPKDFVAAAAALGLDVPQLDELCKAASIH